VTILFAYDGSESADAAIAAAGKLFGHDRMDAVVLTVWEPLVVEALRATRFGGAAPVPTDVTEVNQHAENQAEQLAEHGALLADEAASKQALSGSRTNAKSRPRSSSAPTNSTPT
jgi:hypothetical protein